MNTVQEKPEVQSPPLSDQIQKAHRWRLRIGERQTLVVLGDFIMAILALVIALYVWASGPEWLNFSLEFLRVRPPIWFYLLPLVWMILLVETYNVRRASNWQLTIGGVVSSAIIGLILYLGIFFFSTNPKELPRRGVAAFILTAPFLTLGWRWVIIQVFHAPQFLRRVLVVGGGIAGATLFQAINELNPPPFHIAGIIDDDPNKEGSTIESYPVLGNSNDLLEIIAQEQISDILVAITGEIQSSMFQALLDAQEQGVEITRMPVAFEELFGRIPIHHLEADWVLRSFVDQARTNRLYEWVKRLTDVIGALVGISVLIIVLPFAALAIFLESGRPIFYMQTRCGRGGANYQMIKIRTMRQDAEADGTPQWASENDERATRVGRLLRKTHLDELPQFINVLRGEMSLVGPRAERPALVTLFADAVPFYRARLITRPGITGWAQINQGYAVTVDDTALKLEYDLYYIKHRNILLDTVIILRTVGTVIGFRGR